MGYEMSFKGNKGFWADCNRPQDVLNLSNRPGVSAELFRFFSESRIYWAYYIVSSYMEKLVLYTNTIRYRFKQEIKRVYTDTHLYIYVYPSLMGPIDPSTRKNLNDHRLIAGLLNYVN